MTLLEWLPILVWAVPFFLIIGYAAYVVWADNRDRLTEDNEVAWLETIPTLTRDPNRWA